VSILEGEKQGEDERLKREREEAFMKYLSCIKYVAMYFKRTPCLPLAHKPIACVT
jgi:hypothetical protein